MGGIFHAEYPSSPKRQWTWSYSPTNAIRIFWMLTYRYTSSPYFAILLVVVCSDEFRFYHLWCIEQVLYPPCRTVLEIWSWTPSTGPFALQTIDTAIIACWPSALWAHLWWYDELYHTLLGYTYSLPLTTLIVWSWVTWHPWRKHKLWHSNHWQWRTWTSFTS